MLALAGVAVSGSIEFGDEAPAAMISGRALGGRTNSVLPDRVEPGPLASKPEPRCQCVRYGVSATCAAAITQEDLLCDICRQGCSLLAFGTPGGDWSCLEAAHHVLIDPIDIQYEPQIPLPVPSRNGVISLQTTGALSEQTLALLAGPQP